ncbi:hypothetical protein DH2020_003814 [Rehmannia glutinosa]|uniref:Uncharacterized protein n=1 Tax=Rehmannia glutinosa TaxID=99300 RepID=A0ABR0XMS7_REHGL
MKMRNKGKVHPFTSSSSSSSYPPNKDYFSVLKLLPAAIFTLISVLSLEDREVLAYMITRSLKSTNPSIFPADDKKKISKKQCFDGHGHKSPALFDCDCFHCYTSFWFRWDSSSNRELIHQAIEAFEEHLNNGEQFKKAAGNGKNKRKEKMGRRKTEEIRSDGPVLDFPAIESPENERNLVLMPESNEVTAEEVNEVERESKGVEVVGAPEDDLAAVDAPAVVVRNHKGLARKVLPDVMGIFSSRLWSLWSPNV